MIKKKEGPWQFRNEVTAIREKGNSLGAEKFL